jgi:peptide deformylase
MKNLISLFIVLFSFQALAHSVHYHLGAPLEIIKIGHPTLTMIADEIPYEDIKTDRIQTLIDDMIVTMKKAGGVGLAAPQVNESIRMFVMKPKMFKKAEAIINPTIEYIEEAGKKDSSEGCLSIPGKTFKVERYKKINIAYFNRDGEYVTEQASGFRAIVAQHEYDHLNGILISDFFLPIFIDLSLEEQNLVPKM